MDHHDWAYVDPVTVPNIVVPPPGPRSQDVYAHAHKHMRGYSSQPKLFPVAFESGHGVTLRDVDGNTYIDLTSGIFVTSLGHCHPKVVEAVRRYAGVLMNCHDFATPIKARALEAIASVMPHGLTMGQIYTTGAESVEAALRVARAMTRRSEFFSFYRDHHGKTMAAVSLAVMDPTNGMRAQGFHLVPSGHCYRCGHKLTYPACNLHCVDALEEAIKQEGTGQVAAVVLEPIQGWAGSVVYQDGFIPKLRRMCDRLGILLIADEVLTGFGRTGKMFCVDHYGVVPDILVTGKGMANGFPAAAIFARAEAAELLEKISLTSTFGGNPMACAAIIASIEVIQEEDLVNRSAALGEFCLARLHKMQEAHPLIGEVRGKGCLLGAELVKSRETREPYPEAGRLVYQKAFRRGVCWIPAGHNLRIAPPLVMSKEVATKALDIMEEAIAETERELLGV
jgi:4-aminobutyrate aminotransferase-like enzyme